MLSLALLLVSTPPKFELTIESIMRGPALVGHAPRGLRWSADGSQLRFSWAKATGAGDPTYKTYVVNRDGSGLGSDRVTASGGPQVPRGIQVGNKIAYEKDGDIFLYDVTSAVSQQLTKTPDVQESNPRLVGDGSTVVYVSGDNLFRLNIADGAVTQLTTVRLNTTPGVSEGNRINDVVKGVEVRLPAGFRNNGLTVTPSGTHATVDLFESTTTTGKRAPVPNYITGSGYPEMISTYERVGAPQGHSKELIVDLKSGAVVEIATPRPGRVSRLQWAPDGKHAVAWAYAEDHKDAWLYGFDIETDKATVLWDEHDDAWIGGPGRGLLGWLPDSSRVYFETEKGGFANLVTLAVADGSVRNLTEGKFEVSDVTMDAERKRFVFVSSEGSPFKRHVDEVGFDGGPRTKLAGFSADEDAVYSVSPNGNDIAVVKSEANRPAELFINGKQVTTTPTEEWLAGPWIAPPVVMIPARDGTPVPARFYKARNWKKGGPAVIFVHGAGYLQNVYDGWSHYFREYMFHHVLADQGYMVLDIDYRGSAGYGKAWRTAIYRHMGGTDLTDVVDGAKWLVQTQGVASDRIGLYGGSYGGFLTLMGMFTTPGVFAAGAALRPVADWASYNHGYTSEILNLPSNDAEAYKQSSPINFVDGLKGSLLICHGMVDTNVTFQDTVRVVQKLIDLGKKDWEVAPYPVEDHAFERPSSWTDEYRRILALFDRVIGPRRVRG